MLIIVLSRFARVLSRFIDQNRFMHNWCVSERGNLNVLGHIHTFHHFDHLTPPPPCTNDFCDYLDVATCSFCVHISLSVATQSSPQPRHDCVLGVDAVEGPHGGHRQRVTYRCGTQVRYLFSVALEPCSTFGIHGLSQNRHTVFARIARFLGCLAVNGLHHA